MRKKSTKVDRITDQSVKNHLDYDTSDNNDIDVKEALRSTICQKSKSKDVGMTKIILPTSGPDNRDRDSGSSDIEGSESDYGNRNKKKNKLEDEETASIRRERNRLAAQRCRQRRRDRIEKLEKICQKLELDGNHLQIEISDLQKEMSDLQSILTNHKCLVNPMIKTEIFLPTLKPMDNKMVSG